MSTQTPFLLQTAINYKNSLISKELSALQANILKGHGRDHVRCVFLQFTANGQDNIKDWIRRLPITSAYKQLADTEQYKEYPLYDAGPVTCFFLTASGYQKLGFGESKIPGDKAFRKGMQKRAADLHDPGTEKWQLAYREAPDAMLLVADDKTDRLDATVSAFLAAIRNNSIRYTIIQKGEALKNETGHGIEHFGYEDALSQPQYLNDYHPGKIWDDTCTLGTVLVPDPGLQDANGKPDESCYGSYFVFRKLEQNVSAFKAREDELADLLFPKEPDAVKELAGAYAVGRFENSDPVVKHQSETVGTDENKSAADNDFEYSFSGDASRCPYHAHIRLTNPRNAVDEIKTAIKDYAAPARITRRGIPYDEAGRNSDMSWYPEGKVGLLFMAYQSSIEESFEKMQRSVNSADGLIGQDVKKENQLWPIKWGNGQYQLKGFEFSNFIALQGGEYFFAPSIPFLKNMRTAAAAKKTNTKKTRKK